MTIRTRLTLQFILITAGIFTLALLFIFRQFKQYTQNEFFTHLESKGHITAEMVLRHESDLKPLEKTLNTASTLPSVGNVSIFNDKLERIFTLNNSADEVTSTQLSNVKEGSGYRFVQGKFEAIGFILRANSGSKYIVIVEDIPDFSKLNTLRNILLLSLLLIVAAVAAGGWFYAGQALHPVSHIVNEVEDILPTDLSRRLKKNNNPDELGHLVTTFNNLLDRIEHAFQMQKGFIANVSHELKNPLATMDAQLQLARHKTRTTPEYDRILASLHEDVKEITETADKLLQLAKIHSGNTPIEFSNLRLDELIFQSRDTLLKTHPEYQVSIDMQKLPDNAEELCINGNESLLKSALINLLDNACKFSDDHKATVVFNFNAKNQIEIRDKGQGIAAEDLPYIFEPFFRSTHNGHKKGSGIGLSLVQSILKLHHIGIETQSSPLQGTTFLMSLPDDNQRATPNENPSKKQEQTAFAMSKNGLKLFFLSLLIVFSSVKCFNSLPLSIPPQYQQGFEVVQDWNKMLLDLVQYSSGYRPPVSARMYAYVGLAAYEASLPALKNAPSMTPQYKGLKNIKWDTSQRFVAPIALNTAYNALTEYFFPHAPYDMKQKRNLLAKQWEKTASEYYETQAIEASKIYGLLVAKSIFQWSATDSIGHQAFLFNYDAQYKSPTHKGAWQVEGITTMPALLPHWGAARTFVTPIQTYPAVAPTHYSEAQNSPFFAQAMEVYASSQPMTEEKEWIAEFWSDDYPNISFCAASRWISIAHQALTLQKADLPKAIETYLKLGFVLNDVAVKVWHEKYTFNVMRPENYIQKHINPTWKALHDTPPFPSYPSGHSAFGAAAAFVLTQQLGDNIPITDRSHEHNKIFKGTPRHFKSFKAMAEENALSRIYMGVHYRMDCEEGLRLGYLVGANTANFFQNNNSASFF